MVFLLADGRGCWFIGELVVLAMKWPGIIVLMEEILHQLIW